MNANEVSFANLRAAYDANLTAGPLQKAAEVREAVTLAMDAVQRLLGAGYRLDQCDRAHECEAAIYAYLKASNPNLRAVLTAAERLGEG
jgi:hypothetical protein